MRVTQEEPGKFHQQENGKILEAEEVNVLQGDHKRLFQEQLHHSKAKKVDGEQESHEKVTNSTHENETMINEILENLTEEVVNKKLQNLNQKRCRKCFIDHFPYHKFCRWENTKRENKNAMKTP